MSDIVISEVRKAVSFSYDIEEIKGRHLSVLASNPAAKDPADQELVEKKDVLNDGSFALTFPAGYEGKVNLKIFGSSGGELSANLSI